MPKELGPLPKAVKEADALKKRVEKLIKECNKTLDNTKLKDKEEKLKQMYRNCFDLKQDVTPLLNRVNELKEEDEPGKVKNYANKKNFELKRLETWQKQLTDSMTKLQPDETEEQYLKKLRHEAGEVTEEEVDDEEVEEEEEEEEEDDEEEEDTADKNKLKDKAQIETKAALKDDEDEEEVEEEEDEDDEEEEEAEKEETPAAKQKAIKTQAKTKEVEEEDEEEDGDEEEAEDEEDEEEEEDDEEEDEDEEETEKPKKEEHKIELSQSMRQFIAIDSYAGDEEGDLSFQKDDILTIIETRDDGWWIAENSQGQKGLVPSTYLQMYNKYKNVQQEDEEEDEEDDAVDGEAPSSTRATKLWKNVKKAVNETTVSDVLHAMGAVPSGFRPSTLSKLFNESDTYRMNNYLSPKLSTSNLSYRDLFFDPNTNKIRTRIARVERVVTLLSCQQIPHPGSGITVHSRHVRMCLFDGHNMLSNIHTVKVSSTDKSERTWSFSTRVSDLMDPYYHGEAFVRTNNTVDNLGILFELCVSYVRTSTEEKGEFSCGWAHLPLLDQGGAVVQTKSYDLYMNGGTPYEKGVEVDPSISRRAGSNALVSLISGNKQPRLHVRVAIPKNDQKQLLDQMPDTLCGNMSLLNLYCYHRQILADVLLRDRLDLDSTELIHSPTLATFPRVADQHDLMKVLRESWVTRIKTAKRAERRDEEFMKDTFQKVFTESVYPLYHISTLPPYITGDTDIEEARFREIDKFQTQKRDRRSALAALLSSDILFSPFDLQEVSFNVIGPHCLAKPVNMGTVEG